MSTLAAMSTSEPSAPSSSPNAELTETQLLEKDLKEAQRLAALGLSTAGILHDMANVLTGISGINSLLLRAVLSQIPPIGDGQIPEISNETAEAISYAHLLNERVKHCADLVQHWNDIIKARTSDDCKPVDCRVLIEQGMKYVHSMISLGLHDPHRRGSPKTNLTIVYEYQDKTKKLMAICNGLALLRIIQNLTTNAIHAMAGKNGTIRIVVYPHNELPRILIAIQDQGHGISEKDRAKLFKAFHTTKQGFGTGLGLYTCLKLAEEMGGTIYFQSVVDEGTTFVIDLPEAV